MGKNTCGPRSYVVAVAQPEVGSRMTLSARTAGVMPLGLGLLLPCPCPEPGAH